jgi:hypothetical protein
VPGETQRLDDALAGEENTIVQEHAAIGIAGAGSSAPVLQFDLKRETRAIMSRWVSTMDELLFVILETSSCRPPPILLDSTSAMSTCAFTSRNSRARLNRAPGLSCPLRALLHAPCSICPSL